MRALKGAALFALGLALLAAAITWSWTFTPLGRLDYLPAVMARLASWQTTGTDFSPEARRSVNQMTRGLDGEAVDLPRIEDRTVSSDGVEVPVRVYWPDGTGQPLPLYLDIHGGGWWMGDGHIFHASTTRFAAQARAIVVSVDYRLAPEHPYPAGLDDCYATLLWMHENAASLGGDPERIAVGGRSAGGNLAAAVALRARDRGGPRLLFQYLFVPATDLSGTRAWPSYTEAGDDYLLKASDVQQMIERYVPDPAQRTGPYASPILAGDLGGLPPALVVTAHFDPLRDEGEAYAERLREAGVPVTLHREPGLHGLMGSPERMAKVESMAAQQLRAALERPATRPEGGGE